MRIRSYSFICLFPILWYNQPAQCFVLVFLRNSAACMLLCRCVNVCLFFPKEEQENVETGQT